MRSLAESLNTPRHVKKPTKPASGYNLYYQAQTKRVRKRETALQLFNARTFVLHCSSSTPMGIAAAIGENVADLSPTKKANSTQLIGGKWKSLSEKGKELYAIQSKAELERYHANKKLWVALDSILHQDGQEGRTLMATLNGAAPPLPTASIQSGQPHNFVEAPPRPTTLIQSGQPDTGVFTRGIHEGNEKYRHLMIFLI